MKKYVISICLMILTTLLVISGCSFATTGNLQMQSNKTELKKNEEAEISVRITENLSQILSIDGTIEIDENVFDVISIKSSFNNDKVSSQNYDILYKYYYLQLRSPIDLKENDEILKIKVRAKQDVQPTTSIISISDMVFSDYNFKEHSYEGENANIELSIINDNQEDDEGALYLKSEIYRIGENDLTKYEKGDKYISKVMPKTKISDFLTGLKTNGKITVYNADGSEAINADDIVKTGMKIKVTKDNNGSIDLTIVVMGDANGNGRIDMADLTKLRSKLYVSGELTELEEKALDITFTQKISTKILTILRNVLYESGTLQNLI